MIFPMTVGSDPDYFYNIAKSCSASFSHCTDPFRPIGIIYYYALLLSIFEDNVTFTYIVLSLNIFYIFGVFSLLNKLINHENNLVLKIALFTLVLFNMVCFVPFTMSDPIAILFFVSGAYVLLKHVNLSDVRGKNKLLIFCAGCLFALAGLFKQNYFAFGGLFAIIYFVVFLVKNKLQVNYKTFILNGILFSLGCLLISLQIFDIYYYYHHIGLFVPFQIPNSQPHIQSFGYTNVINSSKDIVPGFYFTELDKPVNSIFYYAYKAFLGLSRFNLTLCYVDRPTPGNIIYLTFINYFFTFALFAFLFCMVIFNKTRYRELILLLSGIIIAIFISISFHVEIRYYALPRILIYSVLLRNILLRKACNQNYK